METERTEQQEYELRHCLSIAREVYSQALTCMDFLTALLTEDKEGIESYYALGLEGIDQNKPLDVIVDEFKEDKEGFTLEMLTFYLHLAAESLWDQVYRKVHGKHTYETDEKDLLDTMLECLQDINRRPPEERKHLAREFTEYAAAYTETEGPECDAFQVMLPDASGMEIG